MKTIVGLFDDFAQAQAATWDLERTGIEDRDISLMVKNEHVQYGTGSASAAEDKETVIAADAAAGAMIGGATGLVMALTGLVVPGFGVIAAAGWFLATLTGASLGAAAGGLLGALTGAGIPLEDAIYYKEGLNHGGTLLMVKAPDEKVTPIAQVLRANGAVDIEARASQYRQAGLQPTAPEA